MTSRTLTFLLAVTLMAAPLLAAAPAPGPRSFTLTETSGQPGSRLATVSFPLAEGELMSLPGASVTGKGGAVPAQVRVLNKHRDGSLRRVLLRFPWNPAAGAKESFKLNALQKPTPGALVTASDHESFTLAAGPRTLRTAGRALVLSRGGQPEARLSFSGVEFPQRFLGPEVTVIENGPQFAWVNLTYYGGYWNVYVEVQADARGQVRVTGRLRRMSAGTAPVPQFGLEVSGLSTELATDKPQPLPFAAAVADGGPRELTFGSGKQPTVLTIPDGAQVRQGRVSVTTAEGGARFVLARDTSLDATLLEEHKQFYEGQERAVELLLPPPGGKVLTCQAEIGPARRSVAVLGEPTVAYGKLQALRQLNTEAALKLVCRDGDQFGDVTSAVSRTDPKWSITGLTRIDTGLDMLEDYYHGGDPRLRDLAVGWAENWVTLKQYRGWDMNAFGGERYTQASWNYIPSYNQKGIMMVALAYEETGDPRYREAALAFADRVTQQLKTRWFAVGSALAPPGIGYDANIRPGYMGRDLVLMYRWTGRKEYLEAAKRIFYGLAGLRDGGRAQGSAPTNGTGQGGYGLLREGYSDPYSAFERLLTGTDLGVTEDNSDHLKPYILEYLLEGAQYVYEETKDPVARATMLSLSEFMLGARQDGGFWNYAQRHAAEGNSMHMTIEMANGLLNSYRLTGDKRYKEAAFETFHCVCKAYVTYGAMMEGVVPPPDRQPFYPGDHCDLDFYRGGVTLDGINRDPVAYLFSALDRMLRLDPQADQFLLSPPTHPRHKWLIEQVPVGGLTIVNEIGYNYIAKVDTGQPADAETGGKSTLVLLEDGKPLGPAHSLHQLIRDEGKGRYSHWNRNALYFSASDNTNPLENGRVYSYYYGSPDQIPPLAEQKVLPTRSQGYGDRRPHPAVALFAAGLKAEREQRWTDALAVWEDVLKQWPSSAPELYRQIALWEKAGKAEQRAATCRRFLQAFPRHDRAPEVRLTLVSYLLAQGQADEARKLLEEGVKQYQGSYWGEEMATRLWRECGVGQPPATIVRAVPGTSPQPQALAALQAHDGLPAPVQPQVGAAYDDQNLYLKFVLPLGTTWPGPGSHENLRLFLDPQGDLTSYQLYITDDLGSREERPAMWHNRQQGIVAGTGWQVKVTREAQGWTADLTIPFAKLGAKPGPGRHTWRLGYRWDSLSGMRFWRPSMPYNTRPQDCGWLVFE